MKLLFWILLAGALIMALLMRFESSRSGIPDFNIMCFEYPADREELEALISEWSLDSEKADMLQDQLGMDYIFMSFVFPAILVLCFWAKMKIKAINGPQHKRLSALLSVLGGAQLVAWLFDFIENARLEDWLSKGQVDNIFLFKEMVLLKFGIGILGFLVAVGAFVILSLQRDKG